MANGSELADKLAGSRIPNIKPMMTPTAARVRN
jgi:hypothetical protein